jgi:hypothetical protein
VAAPVEAPQAGVEVEGGNCSWLREGREFPHVFPKVLSFHTRLLTSCPMSKAARGSSGWIRTGAQLGLIWLRYLNCTVVCSAGRPYAGIRVFASHSLD